MRGSTWSGAKDLLQCLARETPFELGFVNQPGTMLSKVMHHLAPVHSTLTVSPLPEPSGCCQRDRLLSSERYGVEFSHAFVKLPSSHSTVQDGLFQQLENSNLIFATAP
jgi:hypothetical protein